MESLAHNDALNKLVIDIPKVSKIVEEKEKEIFMDVEEKYQLKKYEADLPKESAMDELNKMYEELKVISVAKQEAIQYGKNSMVVIAELFQQLKEIMLKEEVDCNEIRECMNYVVERMTDVEEERCGDNEELFEQKKAEIQKKKVKQSNGFETKRVFRKTSKHLIHLKDVAFDMKPIQSWTGLKKYSVIFDSDVDGSLSNTLNERVLGKKEHLKEYPQLVITTMMKIISFFSLSKDDICIPKKFVPLTGIKNGILLRENDSILSWIGNSDFGIAICKPGSKDSFCRKLSLMYQDMFDTDLNDTNYPVEFTTKRVLAIQLA
ncbi:TLDc domain-containing protein [Entamoeba marina]